MRNILIDDKSEALLVNRLREYRRAAGLTQSELARIVASGGTGSMFRHEQWQSSPSLFIALSYQALYKAPVSEIFTGMMQAVEIRIEAQLAEFESYLGERSALGPGAETIARKLEWLGTRRSSGPC